jgi:hypothetical protein
MKTHEIKLSNGRRLGIAEGHESVSIKFIDEHDDPWTICEINRNGVLSICNDAHSELVRGLRSVTCGETIYEDGDWAFAMGSLRPWAKEPIHTASGKSIMRLYERYKPTLTMLAEEGDVPVTKDFFEYAENAFDAQCLRSQP